MCDHLAQPYEDTLHGDLICTQCGLVMDRLYSYSYSYSCSDNNQVHSPAVHKNRPMKTQTEHKNDARWISNTLSGSSSAICIDDKKDEIKSIFLLLNVNGTEFIENAARVYSNLKQQVNQSTKKIHIPKLDRTLIAYSIWDSFNIGKSPRSIDDVATVCEIKAKNILMVEKILNIEHTFCNSEDYVDRIVTTLGLPYFFTRLINHILHYTKSLAQHKPANRIAAIIICLCQLIHKIQNSKICIPSALGESALKYLTEKTSEQPMLSRKKWNVPAVSKILNLSPGVIYRVLRSMPKDDNMLEVLNMKFR